MNQNSKSWLVLLYGLFSCSPEFGPEYCSTHILDPNCGIAIDIFTTDHIIFNDVTADFDDNGNTDDIENGSTDVEFADEFASFEEIDEVEDTEDVKDAEDYVQDSDTAPQCLNNIDCAPLDDDNLCDDRMICVEGVCYKDSTPVDCSNTIIDSCQEAVCNPVTGECEVNNFPENMPCNDNDACTILDKCENGSCKGAPAECPCVTNADCAKFEDDDLCNGNYACDLNGNCVIDETTIIACLPKNNCEAVSCDKNTGTCDSVPVTNCNDEIDCTIDSCDPAIGCVFAPDNSKCADTNQCTKETCTVIGCVVENMISAECDDAKPCTINDKCIEGICAGYQKNCDDSEICTDDSCDFVSGSCVNTPIEQKCDDGSDCTWNDMCIDGSCKGEKQPVCSCSKDSDCVPLDDDNFCNGIQRCNTFTKQCYFDPESIIFCDSDSDTSCVKNQCIKKNGKCEMISFNEGKSCDELKFCVADAVCVNGVCKGKSIPCDDNNPCTNETCFPNQGCLSVPTDGMCNDNDACTNNDACKNGECKGAMIDCNDGHECTSDLCNTETGCVHYAFDVLCPSGTVCTTVTCDLEKGCVTKQNTFVCDDNDVCTLDSCDPTIGCIYTTLSISCDDNDVCTENDKCSKDGCEGMLINCDDNIECTMESCKSQIGCVYTQYDSLCDDKIACTTDSCGVSGCINAPNNSLCDDGNNCTDDSCDSKKSCVYIAKVGTSCDDFKPCTDKDTCVAGECKGTTKSCDDKNSCTTELCDPVTGCVYTKLSSGICNDSNASTPIDLCVSGICTGYTKYKETFEDKIADGWTFSGIENFAFEIGTETSNPKQITAPNALNAFVKANTVISSDTTITGSFVIKKNPPITNLIYYRHGGIDCSKGKLCVYRDNEGVGCFCSDTVQWTNFQIELPLNATSIEIRFEVTLYAGLTVGPEKWVFLGIDDLGLE